MATISKHTCIGDTRWDTLAHLAYGDFSKITELADVNRNLDVRAIIPSGTIVNVPIIEMVESDVIGLPPWKQQATTEGVETAKASAGILLALQTSVTASGSGSFDGSFD
jgi:hypothetical protein